MFGAKQEQQAASGAIAIQAGGNVSIGLQLSEVRELVQLFLNQNFPVLREEAKAAAEGHVQKFLGALEEKVIRSAATIDPTRFKDPDVQATMNDAVQASARKGDAIDTDVLCALIAERISIRPGEFKDIVISESVKVVPLLTAPQVSMVSLVHFVNSMWFGELPSLRALEPWAQAAMPAFRLAAGLSMAQKRHVEYAGACSYINMVETSPYGHARQQCAHLGYDDANKFYEDICAQAPTYAAILNQYSADHLWCISLTSVGQAIALANLTRFLPGIDYSVWLK